MHGVPADSDNSPYDQRADGNYPANNDWHQRIPRCHDCQAANYQSDFDCQCDPDYHDYKTADDYQRGNFYSDEDCSPALNHTCAPAQRQNRVRGHDIRLD